MMQGLFTYLIITAGLLAAASERPSRSTNYGDGLRAARSAQCPLLVILDRPDDREYQTWPAQLASAGDDSELLKQYHLCHVDVTTPYGKRVAHKFHATQFPHTTIIDKTGSFILYQKSGQASSEEWVTMLASHQRGEWPPPNRSTGTLSGVSARQTRANGELIEGSSRRRGRWVNSRTCFT